MSTEAQHSVPRPAGVVVLSAFLFLTGLGSLCGVVQLFPQWLGAARQHHYASSSYVWVELVAAGSALSAGFGLWRGQWWARIPFIISVCVSVGSMAFIAAFGLGDQGTVRGWSLVGIVTLVVLLIAGLLIRYVWRHTRGAA
jgi:hypothetical protein